MPPGTAADETNTPCSSEITQAASLGLCVLSQPAAPPAPALPPAPVSPAAPAALLPAAPPALLCPPPPPPVAACSAGPQLRLASQSSPWLEQACTPASKPNPLNVKHAQRTLLIKSTPTNLI